MKQILIGLLLFNTLYSCVDSPKYTQQDILGDWQTTGLFTYTALKFKPNGICDNHFGFWRNYLSDNGVLKNYLSRYSPYVIDKDTLKIWNIKDNEWDRAIIKSVNKDSIELLAVYAENGNERLNRSVLYSLKAKESKFDFETVLVGRLDKGEGEFVYLTSDSIFYWKTRINHLKDDVLENKVSSAYYLNSTKENNADLLRNFKVMDVAKFLDYYPSGWATYFFEPSYFILYFNKNLLQKSVEISSNDYAPFDLRYGYEPLLFAPLYLKKINIDDRFPEKYREMTNTIDQIINFK